MKCFQITLNDVIPGLPIVHGKDRPYVKVGHLRAYLSNDLLESNPGARLLNADVEAVTSDESATEARFCFVREKRESQAVLVVFDYRSGLTEAVSKVVGPTGNGSESAVVLQRCDTSQYIPYGGRIVSESALAILAPYSRIDMQQSWKTRLPREPGLRNLFTRRKTQPHTRDVPFLHMSEGTPVLTPPPRSR